MKSPKFNAEQWAQSADKAWKAALSEIAVIHPDVVPPGWKNTSQLAQLWSVGLKRASLNARQLVQTRKAERKGFYVVAGKQRKSIPFYKLL